jgi:predicted TIM-barrel fold metal-dependent hydrolase
MFLNPKCIGIKIHPEEHSYPINQFGDMLFKFAANLKAIILTHSGDKNSMSEEFMKFADGFPEVTLILAHYGWSLDGDPTHQVRAIQKSKYGNILTDTSSATNIIPRQIEWGVKELGAEKILFRTDTPLYFAPMQRSRIDHAEIGDEEKKQILRDNALKLLKRKE